MQPPRLENSTNKRRRLVRLSAILAVVFLLLSLAAVLVDWIGTYLLPVVMIFGGLVGTLGVLAWAALTLYNSGNKIF